MRNSESPYQPPPPPPPPPPPEDPPPEEPDEEDGDWAEEARLEVSDEPRAVANPVVAILPVYQCGWWWRADDAPGEAASPRAAANWPPHCSSRSRAMA